MQRNLFSPAPAIRPVQLTSWSPGDPILGKLRYFQPGGAPVDFTLTQAPTLGTVQLLSDGTYTYVGGADFQGTDTFTIRATSGGINLLEPFTPRTANVTVTVSPTALVAADGDRRGYDVVNLTAQPATLQGWGKPVGFNADGPSFGSVMFPGQSQHFELEDAYTAWDVTALYTGRLAAPPILTWTADFRNGGEDRQFFKIYTSYCKDGGAPCSKSYRDQAGVYTQSLYLLPASPTTSLGPGGSDAELLFNWFRANPIPRDLAVSLSMTNVQFIGNPPGDPGYVRVAGSDNLSDAVLDSEKYTVSASTSTTNSSEWELGGDELWAPIKYALTLLVADKYTTEVTDTKTFSRSVEQGALPWSANEILAAPQKLLVTGDATYVVNTEDNQGRPFARTFSFSGVQFYFPSQTASEPLYVLRSEPLQPKYTEPDAPTPDLIGTPKPNVGFTVRDPKSEFESPIYKVGELRQLKVTAFNGYGDASADKTVDPSTKYTSSNEAVAVVDSTGALRAVGPGTAVITARYDWTMPYGGGTDRRDYVLATLKVTVQ